MKDVLQQTALPALSIGPELPADRLPSWARLGRYKAVIAWLVCLRGNLKIAFYRSLLYVNS